MIVVDIDGGAMLRQCLDSIRAQSIAPREVIVFDNGSRTPLQMAGVRVLRRRKPPPPPPPPPHRSRDSRSRLAPNGHRRPRCGFHTGRRARSFVATNGPSTVRGSTCNGTLRQIGHGLSIGTVLPDALASATAALIRRAALGEHFFDERFFAYFEDVELCARLHESGWRTVVLPVVKATHRGSASASILGRRAVRFRMRNRYWWRASIAASDEFPRCSARTRRCCSVADRVSLTGSRLCSRL